MGKKKLRGTKVSKGTRTNVSKSLVAGVRSERTVVEKLSNKIEAWKKGQNPWLTIENPSKSTNQAFIRIRANEYYGDFRNFVPKQKESSDDYNL